MVYQRKGRKSYEAKLLMRNGDYQQVALRTSSKLVAAQREAMWTELAREHQAWDLLERVLEKTLRLDRLHDLWKATHYNVHEVRRRLVDADVSGLVPEWHAIYVRSGVAADTAAHALAHVRALIPEGQRVLASSLTVERLTALLYGYRSPPRSKRAREAGEAGELPSPNTLRKVHANVSQFFDYLTRVKGLYPGNPMQAVEPPGLTKTPIRFHEASAVERIVGAQPDAMRRALMALAYGGAIEVSVTLRLTRADLWPATKECRSAGTKTHTRDRVSRIADWAWPIVWAYAKDFLPTARLFPADLNRHTVSDWHRQTQVALGIPALPLHNARHHWAVRALRAGTPVQVVQLQLGHSSSTITLQTYGRFLPSAADRDHWERQASAHEARRREAQ